MRKTLALPLAAAALLAFTAPAFAECAGHNKQTSASAGTADQSTKTTQTQTTGTKG